MALVGVALIPRGSGATKLSTTKPVIRYYVSLGDSYSVGFQPDTGASPGFTAYVAKSERMTLRNFGCGSATTTSILKVVGCVIPYGPPASSDAVAYPAMTQEQAAIEFIEKNPRQVALITVSIGGNDVIPCAFSSDPVSCVAGITSTIKSNVTVLVANLDTALKRADDRNSKIVGLTYPDVILGDQVYPPRSTNPALAQESVVAFDNYLNPTLKAAYISVNRGEFVNITQAAYGLARSGDDSTTKVRLKPYGVIPASVWEICNLTWFCLQGDIHPNANGYDFIGRVVVARIGRQGDT